MPLNDAACKSLKPKEKPYKKGDAYGLYLLVNPNGNKLWRMKYHFHNKERTVSFGPYPEVSLAEARDRTYEARKLLREGKDPSLEKQEAKRMAAINAADTFEAVAMEWYKKNLPRWRDSNANTVMTRLRRDVFPAIGYIPVRDLTPPRIALAVQTIEKRGAYELARRALGLMRNVLAYAKVCGRILHNPADVEAKDVLAAPKKGHFAAMESAELPAFLAKLYQNEGRLFRQTQLAMELLMLTFVRTNELIKSRWEEINFEKALWYLPAERMKMGRDHIVPLSRQALAAFTELKKMNGHRPYIFPGQRDPLGHLSNNAILVALGRMGYRGVHTGHGFRALAMSTILEELDYGFDVIDVQLAHGKKTDVAAAYNRAKYLKERTRMMQDWADHIERIAAENKVGCGKFAQE
ncbi:MAG: integrase arm-type DNA-binding domain-containing protein [Alphaproteobacteria bacterium]|nr:integrase arm-type DNA-binding domain-containing protein [Alphaproteobacteria bacterium]